MASSSAKAALFDAQSSVARALGNGRRAEIVDVLAQGERSVDELAGEISQSVANTSQHLQVLAKAGLVRSHREGARVYYRLASDRVGELWAAVREVAARHVAEVGVLADEYLGKRDAVEQVTAAELEQRLARGEVVVLDVRPEVEFRAGHITGARSVPLEELDSLAASLPRRKQIVAYCRGPYCVYADDAVRLLRERGLKARRLDVGYPEWHRAGRPTRTATAP
jgi:rhodanese-related sulfurtransferase/DNA-binding HxlR family transcriptional regulator